MSVDENYKDCYSNYAQKIESLADTCPFCGEKPSITFAYDAMKRFSVSLKCINIMCHINPKSSFYDGNFKTACDMVLKGWNQREQKENDSKNLDLKEVCACINCTNSEFDADGCYCKKLGKLVNSKDKIGCQYFQFN